MRRRPHQNIILSLTSPIIDEHHGRGSIRGRYLLISSLSLSTPSIRRPVPKNEGGGAVSRPILRPRRRGILVPRRHRRVDDDDENDDENDDDDDDDGDKNGRRKKEELLVPTTTATISFFPPLFATLKPDIDFLAALRLPQ